MRLGTTRGILASALALAFMGCQQSQPDPRGTGQSREARPAAERPEEHPASRTADDGAAVELVAPEHDAAPGQPTRTSGIELRAPGEDCFHGKECASGICEGEGCGDTPGQCVDPARMCAQVITTFCDCDGVTFESPDACARRRYATRGPCPAIP